MGRTFEAIERAKTERDTQKLMPLSQSKEKHVDTHYEVPVTLRAVKKKHGFHVTYSEQYCQLKVGLLNRWPDLKHKAIMIVSSIEKEGSTTTAVNLAKALASDSNVKVLLIDCNLRSSSLHQVFDLDNRNGLSNILRGETDTGRAIRKTNIHNLFVVTSGESSTVPAWITNGQPLSSLLDRFRDDFDFVVLDAPPVTLYPDSITLCSVVDGVIFVVEAEKTRWEVAEEAKERLRRAGATILGGVLNKRKYYIPDAIYKRL